MKYPNIEEERKHADMSSEALAKKIGVCRKKLSRWIEKGHIPARELIRMADIFNCSIDYLLGRT